MILMVYQWQLVEMLLNRDDRKTTIETKLMEKGMERSERRKMRCEKKDWEEDKE